MKFWCFATLGVLMIMSIAYGADKTLSRRGSMVQDFYETQFRKYAAERKSRLEAVKTRGDALAYQQEIRKRLSASFGELPEKTPLNARVTGTAATDKLIIDKVVLESRPGFVVTGLFYRMKDAKGKMPAILALCGHSTSGKQAPWYQELAQSLALRGYAVFMVDPIGQGERDHFTAEEKVGRSVNTHNMCGKQLSLFGENFSVWRLHDAVRSLDYLLSRPEVDSTRVGVTGTSGGGTMTAFLSAFDSRLTMAAPSSYITTQLRNLENEIPADMEQMPPCFVSLGCDTVDFLIAAAPRPTVILAQNNDFFDPRGTDEAFAEVRKIYSLLGKEKDIELFIGNDDHGYSPEHRQAAALFFNRYSGLADNGRESADIKVLDEKQLDCIPGGKSDVNDFFNAMQQRIPVKKVVADLPKLMQEQMRIDKVQVPEFRVGRTQFLSFEPYQLLLNRFILETEPDMLTALKQLNRKIMFRFAPPEEVILYIPHLSVADEIRDFKFPENGSVFGLEVRGIGETLPVVCNVGWADPFHNYEADYFYAACGNMLDKPYLGRKVYDILSAVKLLEKHGVKKIHLVGKGRGSVPVALAALLLPSVTEVSLYNAPLSWEDMVRQRVVIWPLSTMLPGILKYADLPDVYRVLADKNLKIYSPWNSLMQPYAPGEAEKSAEKYGIADLLKGGE